MSGTPERAQRQQDQPMVAMGEVVAAYGVRGWVKVKPFTETADSLLGYRTWWVQHKPGDDWKPVSLRDGRPHSATLVAQIAGVDSRETAMQWKGTVVGVPRDELPVLERGELYRSDLVGLDVVNRGGSRLGRVRAVDDFGAHPVLRVERDRGGDTLIPFVPVYVDAVDIAAKRIDVDWEVDY